MHLEQPAITQLAEIDIFVKKDPKKGPQGYIIVLSAWIPDYAILSFCYVDVIYARTQISR